MIIGPSPKHLRYDPVELLAPALPEAALSSTAFVVAELMVADAAPVRIPTLGIPELPFARTLRKLPHFFLSFRWFSRALIPAAIFLGESGGSSFQTLLSSGVSGAIISSSV